MILFPLLGCTAKQLVIYPIKGTDFCVKSDPDCKMSEMDIGMSDFYFKRVLEIKNSKDK